MFKKVKDFPNYQVSELGIVMKGEKVIKATLNRYRGYFYVMLYNKKERKNRQLHRLVLETFTSFQKGKEVNHADGKKGNNQLSNLEWVTRSQNHLHAVKLGLRGRPVGNPKYSEEKIEELRRLRKSGLFIREISKKLDIPMSTVTHILLGNIRNK